MPVSQTSVDFHLLFSMLGTLERVYLFLAHTTTSSPATQCVCVCVWRVKGRARWWICCSILWQLFLIFRGILNSETLCYCYWLRFNDVVMSNVWSSPISLFIRLSRSSCQRRKWAWFVCVTTITRWLSTVRSAPP